MIKKFKNKLKRFLSTLIILLEFISLIYLNNQVVLASSLVDRETYIKYLNGEYSGGGFVFRIKEEVEEMENKGENAPYHYFTIGTTATSGIRHRTIGIQISRVRDDVDNPLVSPYVSNRAVNPTTGSNDPHYYYEVTDDMLTGSSSVMYDDPWETYTYNGTMYARQYVTILISDIQTIIGGKIYSQSNVGENHDKTIDDWIIPYDALWNQIKFGVNCDGWYDNIQQRIADGKGVTFAVDNVKTLNYYGDLNAAGKTYTQSGIYYDSNGNTYNGNGYWYVDYYNPTGGSPVVWTWANYKTAPKSNGRGITTSMLSDYYWKYYYEGTTVPEDPVEPSTEVVKTTGKFNLVKNETDTDTGKKTTNTGNTTGSNTTNKQSQNAYASPGIYTYNDSDTYELGVAIPTSNEYTNGVVLDGWYGNVEITQTTYSRQEQTTNYEINYTWEKWVQSTGIDEDTGEVIDTSHYETQYETEYANSSDIIYSTWRGTYTTITDVDLYELQSAITTNGAGGTLSYADNILTHVPYSITINGKVYTSGGKADGSDDSLVTSFAASESYHVKENAVDTSRITVNVGSMGQSKPSHATVINAGKGQVQAIWNSRVKNNEGLVTLQNDELTLDGVVYLTNPASMTQDTSGIWQKNGNINWTYQKDATHEMSEAKTNNIKEDQSTASIPSTVMNGYYYTNISATYKSFINSKKQTVTMAIKDNLGDNTSGTVHNETNDSAEPAIIRTSAMAYKYAKSSYDYSINEPVVVHTPVIAPIHISDSESKTQLVDSTGMSLSQLILDHEYTVQFDWQAYFTDLKHYKGYEAPAGWTKYIQEKYVAFPFSVKVGDVYYDPQDDGYTDWISVGATTTSFTFYLPSWSQEGLYYDPSGTLYNTWNSYAMPIKVRVEAENMNSFKDYTQVEYNGDKENYVATFTYPCQVSGILYDFQVVSVYDSTNFATASWVDEAGADIFNFVKESERTGKLQAEKNVGNFNRLGLAYMRYTLDGDMTDAWNYANTLAMMAGKSVYGNNTGYLVKGNTIAFTVKTIANLTGQNDYVKISPSYRYYASDGTLYDTNQIDLYYLDNGNLIKVGSDADKDRMRSNSLYTNGGSIWYQKSYFDYYYDTFKSTAKHKAALWNDSDITENYVKLGKMEESYSVSEITLNQSLCLWTGNEEELNINLQDLNTADTAKRYADTYNGVSVSLSKMIDNLAYVSGRNYINKGFTGVNYKDDYWSFESSMQTWYGKYKIPSELYVAPKGAVEDWVEENGYIDFTEDFWLPDDGKLVLNFDIETYMDGNEHLQYYGSTGAQDDMWSREHNGPNTPTDPTNPNYRPGDVGEIELDYGSVKSHKNIGLLYLN